jgi:hypothetical protein
LDDGSIPTVEQVNKFFIFAKEIGEKIKLYRRPYFAYHDC